MMLSVNIINIFSIIALILKIIGIVLLSVIGFIVLLFVLIFLVPIRYKVSAHNDRTDMTNFQVTGRVTYLLHILSVHFSYTKGSGAFYKVKLFNIGIISSDKPKKPKKEKQGKKGKKNKKGKKDKEEEYYEDPEGLSGLEDFTSEEPGDTEGDKALESSDITQDNAEKSSDVSADTSVENSKELKKRAKEEKKREKEEKKRIKEAKKQARRQAKEYKKDSGSKLDTVKEKIEEVKKIINNPANRRLFTKVKKELFYLLKHYLPRKLKGHLEFGFESPDTTGKILGAMSLFPVFYRKDFKLAPDFNAEKTYFCGEIEASGRIRLIHLLKTAVILVLDRDFRRVVFKKKLY